MKVAVSIPDPLFAEADALARRLKLSRSKVYARALAAFIASYTAGNLTDEINAALEAIGDEGRDRLVGDAGRRTVLKHSEW